MSERTHFNETKTVKSVADSKRKLTLVLAGTCVAALAAGVLFQVLRAEPAQSSVDGPGDQAAGTARVAKAPLNSPRYLARVNGQLVSWEEVAVECMARYGGEVLDSVINRTIIRQACADRGLSVTRDAIDAEVMRIAKKFNLDAKNWYAMLRNERHLSPQQYRRDVIWPMLALRKIANEKIIITDGDLQRAFVRDYGPRVKVKMIMLNRLTEAQKVWKLARSHPEQFGRLAREHSIESTSKSLDGDVPPIQRYSGNDKLEEEAFKLRTGEISGIIQIGSRYVILKSLGRTRAVVKNIEQVRKELYASLMEEKVQKSVAKVFSKIKEGATIHNFLTNTTQNGLRQTTGTASGSVRSAAGTRPVRQPASTTKSRKSGQTR